MNENNLTLSLVVPCYNEEENIELFFDEVNKAFDGKIEDYEFEIGRASCRERV